MGDRSGLQASQSLIRTLLLQGHIVVTGAESESALLAKYVGHTSNLTPV